MSPSSFFEIKEVQFPSKDDGPSLVRFSQYLVRNRGSRYVVGVYESEEEANLVAAKKNYMLALREYSDWSQFRSEGYNLNIEHDSLNRVMKREAFQALAKKSLEESARVEGFDHSPKPMKKF